MFAIHNETGEQDRKWLRLWLKLCRISEHPFASHRKHSVLSPTFLCVQQRVSAPVECKSRRPDCVRGLFLRSCYLLFAISIISTTQIHFDEVAEHIGQIPYDLQSQSTCRSPWEPTGLSWSGSIDVGRNHTYCLLRILRRSNAPRPLLDSGEWEP